MDVQNALKVVASASAAGVCDGSAGEGEILTRQELQVYGGVAAYSK